MKNHGNGTDVSQQTDIPADIQFLTLETVPGYDIHHCLCAIHKNPNIVMKSTVNH